MRPPHVIVLPWILSLAGLGAMQVSGYDPAVHDRFSGGYPAAPVRNADAAFIGLAHDWTGVGWNGANARASYGFLSPRHHILARHFSNSNDRRVFGNDSVVWTIAHGATVDIGFGLVFSGETAGDLALTTLAAAVPDAAALPRYPILDLNSTSTANAPSLYNGRALLIYGHWGFATSSGSPRIAATTMGTVTVSGNNHSFRTPRSDIELEGNDSGSPAFALWNDPDGTGRIALVGNHASVNDTYNLHNFLGTHQVMAGIAAVMTPDGHAPWIVGEAVQTWQGGNGSMAQRDDLFRSGNWTPNASPGDRFVLFRGDQTAWNAIDVNTSGTIRGLHFRNTGVAGNAFTFGGSGVLSVGRGGVINRDVSRQVFQAPLRLAAPQFWDAGPGGVAIQALDTNGRLLEIRSAGESRIDGPTSGTGSLALESGRLVFAAGASHTGITWIHQGELTVTGDLRDSASVQAGPKAVIRGSGRLPEVAGGGRIEPGPGAAVLTAAALSPGAATGFHFDMGRPGAPDYANAADAGNSVLRLTDSPPLAGPLGAGNPVVFWLDGPLEPDAVEYTGGLFFDDAAADWALVESAGYEVFVADPTGGVARDGVSYSPLSRGRAVSLVPETADFGDGTVSGLILRLSIDEAPFTYDRWAAEVFPAGFPEADTAPLAVPNADRVPNLLAYALALNPMANNSANLPVVECVEDGLVIRYRRNTRADDIARVVETSSELSPGSWTAVGMPEIVIDPDPDGDGSAEKVEVSIPIASGTQRIFARLRVSFAP